MARKKNYLNNKDLYAQMVLSKDADKLTPTAEKMLILLAEKAIRKIKYISDDDRNDCLQFAMLDLLKYWKFLFSISINTLAKDICYLKISLLIQT